MRLLYEHLTDIPVNFTEVEYLQSTGIQYIDTGFKPNQNTKIEIIGKFNNVFPCCLWATRWTQAPTYDTYGAYAENNAAGMLYIYYGRYSDGNFSSVSNSTFPHRDGNFIRFIQDKNKLDFTNLGTNDNWTYTFNSTTFQSTRNLTLFYFSSSSTFATRGGYIKSCKIWDNDVLVRDMISVLDNNNVPCMYDKVEGKAYYNAGTGTFSYGRKIIPVEYLASANQQNNSTSTTSAAWIDTGIIPDDTTKMECRMAFTTLISGISDEALCGSSGSTGNFRFAWGFASLSPYTNFYFGLGGQNLTTTVTRDTNTHIFKLDAINKTWSIDSNTGAFTSSGSLSGTSSIFLFARHIPYYGDDAANKPANANIYYCKIWKGGSLVRDMIPCKDENNVGFMFDKVTNTVFLNSGTGSFTVGKTLPNKKLRLIIESNRRVPKGFTEVEYIQSTGTQYIMSGLSMPNGFRIKGTISIDNLSSTGGVFGCYTNSSPYYRNFFDFTNSKNWLVGYGGGAYQYFGSNVVNTIYNFDVCNVHGKEHLEVNGTEYAFSPTGSTGNFTNLEMPIFALNVSGTIDNIAKIKLYRLEVYDENGVLLRDYIPCLDTNNVPCLWDKVYSKAYYNTGTGTFNYGHTITQVEYLESTGTQYIDTGVYLTNNHSVELDYQLTSASQNRKGIFGGLVANGARYGALLSPSNNYLEFGYGSTNVWYQPGLPDTNRHVMKQEKNLLYFDGSLAYTFNTATFTQSFTSPLGNFNYTNYNPASAKYYSSKWWDNNNLIRNYIPVKDENGIGYMLDTISHTLYSNVGTGSFVVGEELKDITRFIMD